MTSTALNASPTLKAIVSALLICVFLLIISTAGNVIGQDRSKTLSSSAVSPYQTNDTPAQKASHNQLGDSSPSTQAKHNR